MRKMRWGGLLVCLSAILILVGCGDQAPREVRVPILLYHHITEEIHGEDVEILPEQFEAHMRALSEAGYNAVSFQQMVDYVERGAPLPERPVCITLDDGYLSNYEIAWPVLAQHGLKATIFLIGSCAGHSFYKDTGYAVTPYFSWEQAREMVDSGVIELQCHTYDLHQWPLFEESTPVRKNLLPLPGETEEEYNRILTEDFERFQAEYEKTFGSRAFVLSYPEGKYNKLAEQIAHDAGFRVTVGTDAKKENRLAKGRPESLYALGRINVEADMTAEQLLELLG